MEAVLHQQIEKPRLFLRAIFSIGRGTKHFFLGAACALIFTPFSILMTKAAQKIGLIQELANQATLLKETLENIAKTGIKLNAEAIYNSKTPFQEYVNQLNRALHLPPEMQITVFMLKVLQIISIGIVLPIFEELLFRGLVQGVLMKRLPKFLLTKFKADIAIDFNSIWSKTFRITLTAVIFALYHLVNKGFLADSYVSMQIVATFCLGIGFSLLKESKLGLPGAIGAHTGNNLIAIFPTLVTP